MSEGTRGSPQIQPLPASLKRVGSFMQNAPVGQVLL